MTPRVLRARRRRLKGHRDRRYGPNGQAPAGRLKLDLATFRQRLERELDARLESVR